MDRVAATVALVSVATSGAVAIFVPLIAQRAHRKVAHAAWLRGRLADTYIDVLAFLRREMLTIEQIHPLFGPGPEAPDEPPEDELLVLNARVAAYGSRTIRARLETWSAKLRAAHNLVRLINSDETKEGSSPHWGEFEDRRIELRSLVRIIDATVAAELEGRKPTRPPF